MSNEYGENTAKIFYDTKNIVMNKVIHILLITFIFGILSKHMKTLHMDNS